MFDEGDESAVEFTKSVSETSAEGAYYNMDQTPLPAQSEDERRRNVFMYFFRYGKLTESMLKPAMVGWTTRIKIKSGNVVPR
jgi:hypothetical protein